MSVEGARLAIEAGCDLLQHGQHTGPIPFPETTLELMVRKGLAVNAFAFSQPDFAKMRETNDDSAWTVWEASDTNIRNFIQYPSRERWHCLSAGNSKRASRVHN